MDKVTSLKVAKFLQEDVACRHGVPRKIVLNGGAENLGFTKDLMRAVRNARCLDRSLSSPI
jgi:hypothetical protein